MKILSVTPFSGEKVHVDDPNGWHCRYTRHPDGSWSVKKHANEELGSARTKRMEALYQEWLLESKNAT